MKRTLWSLVCLICMAAWCGTLRAETIKGNGKVITKEYQFADFDEISFVGPAEFTYEQSEAAPSVTVTIDENLLPYLEVKVKGKELHIGPKAEGMLGRSKELRPTVFTIKANSKTLEEVSLAGSGSFKADQLVKAKELELNLSGSGTMCVEMLQADELEGNLAGSGNLVVKGKVREAKFNIAGSGDVKADACEAEEVEGNIAGSGDLEAYATRKLKGNIVGSGDIYYKGDPKVESSCLGSGKVKKR